jgi:capsular exopolysaccharide synthesis family protein
MSQFHNLFRKVVVEKEAAPSRPIEDSPVTTEPDYALQNVKSVEVRLEAASRLVFHTDPRSVAAERFRFLRMRLQERWKARKLKSLLITSSLPHEGKSTVALNLATAMAEQGKRLVLLIEADLHHPQIMKQLGLEPSAGLAECLEDHLPPMQVIRRVEPLGWYLLPAGAPRRNATELLQTGSVADLFHDLAGYFDWVLIDSPPVLPLTDALTLKQRSDGSLLVVRAGETSRDAVEQAVNLLGKDHVMGLLLNGVEGLHHLYSKYGYQRP